MLYIQQRLAPYRNNIQRAPYLQTTSTMVCFIIHVTVMHIAITTTGKGGVSLF